ncbi:MAG: NADH-quinone oxidoreductase subunit NuoE, partial [Actinomycetota bacterium]
MAINEQTRAELRELVSRYPEPRSALLPMLHLVQSVDGYITQEGIDVCAAEVGLTTAEVSAVASFYTMFKRYPVGKHDVGVCVN